MSGLVHLTEVDAMVADLAAAGLSVSVDPAEVNPPGVWVRHVGISLDHLGGFTHQLQLHLVVPNNGHARARAALVDLLNAVTAAGFDPDADPFFQGLVLPSSPAPLPGLVVPLNLTDTYQE